MIDTRTLPVGDESNWFVKIARAIRLPSFCANYLIIDDHNPPVFGLEMLLWQPDSGAASTQAQSRAVVQVLSS